MPPLACSISPARGAGRARERAARVAEQLVLEERVGERGAVERDERLLGARTARVQRARDELLPRAGLAGDQHRARRGGRAADQILDLAHRLAVADERVHRAAGADLPLQEIDLAREPAAIGRRTDAHQQLVAEERLLHEVHGAELHRLDRRVDGPEAGHHDEGGVDAELAQLLQHVDARRCRASACPTGSRRRRCPWPRPRPLRRSSAVSTLKPAPRSMRAMLSRTPWSSSMTRMRATGG